MSTHLQRNHQGAFLQRLIFLNPSAIADLHDPLIIIERVVPFGRRRGQKTYSVQAKSVDGVWISPLGALVPVYPLGRTGPMPMMFDLPTELHILRHLAFPYQAPRYLRGAGEEPPRADGALGCNSSDECENDGEVHNRFEFLIWLNFLFGRGETQIRGSFIYLCPILRRRLWSWISGPGLEAQARARLESCGGLGLSFLRPKPGLRLRC